MRVLLLCLGGLLLAGCASDVTLVNPRTGETAVCKEDAMGLNPWSQKDACVGGYESQGWRRQAAR